MRLERPMRIYDTMSKGKVEFEPTEPSRVNMYVCGLTVYDAMHIGHARTFISFDIIARYLTFRGYKTNVVINVTDVEDKIIARAAERGISALELSSMYAEEFLEDMRSLHVTSVSRYVKASEHIPEILSMISTLVDGGYAYEIDGSVYFDVERTHDYGRLSGQSIDQIKAGARVEVDERKRNPGDFALWKAAKPGEVSWKSPWGRGRPGWHIECSAMSMKYLGKTLDIHGGGEDLIFPHHENEIQQSEACTHAKFSKYWMHGALLNVSGAKMSKSLKNFSPVRETLREYPAETIRFYFANSLYRRQIDFSSNSLAESDQARKRLEGYILSVKSASGKESGAELASRIMREFTTAMDDDFNTRDAIASLFTLMKEGAMLSEQSRLSRGEAAEIVKAVAAVNSVLGIVRQSVFGEEELGKEAEELMAERERARKARDFGKADELRARLADIGVIVEDTAEGMKWRRK